MALEQISGCTVESHAKKTSTFRPHPEAGDFFQEEHHLGRNLFGQAFPQMIPREAVLSTTMGIESQQKHATRLLPAHCLAVFCLSGS